MNHTLKTTGSIGVHFILAIITMLLISNISYAQHKGLTPQGTDGFETGDWRNFRPHYIGNSDEFIRPNFTIDSSNPISGNFSLQWQGDNEEHEWLQVSNAFYLQLPAEVSMEIRSDGMDTGWAVGLFLMETYERYTGITVTPEEGGQAEVAMKDLTGKTKNISAAGGRAYRLTVKRSGHDNLTVSVSDVETGEKLKELNGISSVTPEALGIYVYSDSNSKSLIDFDNVKVNASPYRITSGEWVRSPHFVVLPRQSDMEQDQGNWVGAQSTMKKDGEYLMWYRLRDNINRGNGYGFATSENGINWIKHKGNPIFTYDDNRYSSSEKVSVLYVDGLYRAWYTVNVPGNQYAENVTPGSWYIAHATSEDGINWNKHGLVIDETYTKDAVVLYVNDTYYLFAIRDNENIGIHTSSDGVEWEHRNTIPMGVHRHVAATYVERTNEFHLYATGGFAGVSRAISKDGIIFGPFKQVMQASKVGLDDWADAGVTYLSFLTDEYGKIHDDRELPVYYQARNTWDNNIPGWLYHGGERVVLAGHYEGLFIGVETTVLPTGGYNYHRFPFEIPRADGLDIYASRKTDVHLTSWQPGSRVICEGELRVPSSISGHSGQVNTQVQWNVRNLQPGETYRLYVDQQQIASEQADEQGRLLFTAIVSGENELQTFQINKIINQNK